MENNILIVDSNYYPKISFNLVQGATEYLDHHNIKSVVIKAPGAFEIPFLINSKKDFYDQARLIKPYVDFFYLDVISSGKECEIALNVIEKFRLPVLVGLHIQENGKLPSNENISEIVRKYKTKNWLGLVAACVSPEIIVNTADELKQLNIPFGFKANLWKEQTPLSARIIQTKKHGATDKFGINPNEVLGKRDDYTDVKFLEFSKKMMTKGATILGGCCETKPSHINKIASLKN